MRSKPQKSSASVCSLRSHISRPIASCLPANADLDMCRSRSRAKNFAFSPRPAANSENHRHTTFEPGCLEIVASVVDPPQTLGKARELSRQPALALGKFAYFSDGAA